MPPARPSAIALVQDLARRLAEEFDTVPLPMVSRAVKAAADATAMFGDDVASSLTTVERIAREDLVALRDASLSNAALGADQTVPAPIG